MAIKCRENPIGPRAVTKRSIGNNNNKGAVRAHEGHPVSSPPKTKKPSDTAGRKLQVGALSTPGPSKVITWPVGLLVPFLTFWIPGKAFSL